MTRAETEAARKKLNGYFKRAGRVVEAIYYSGELQEVTPEEAVEYLNNNETAVVYGDAPSRKAIRKQSKRISFPPMEYEHEWQRFWIRRKYGGDKGKLGKMSPELTLLRDINRRYGHTIKPRGDAPHGYQFRSISAEDARDYLRNKRVGAPQVYGDEGISPSFHGGEVWKLEKPDDASASTITPRHWYDRFFILVEKRTEKTSTRPMEKGVPFATEDRLIKAINEQYGDKIKERKRFKQSDIKIEDKRIVYDSGDWSKNFLTSREAAERLKKGEEVWGIKDETGQYAMFYSTARMRARSKRHKAKTIRKVKVMKKSTILDRAMRMVWHG